MGRFSEKVLKIRGGSSVSGAVLNKKNILAVLREQMAMSTLQNVFCRQQDVLKRKENPASSLEGQSTQRKVPERIAALNGSVA